MSRPGPYGPGRDCRLPAIVQPSPQQQPPQLLLLQPQPPQFPPPQQQHRMIRMSTIHRQPPPKPLLQPITSTSCKIWCSEGLPSGHSPSYAARTAWCAKNRRGAQSPAPAAVRFRRSAPQSHRCALRSLLPHPVRPKHSAQTAGFRPFYRPRPIRSTRDRPHGPAGSAPLSEGYTPPA